jgi:hypothetical protein
VAGWVGWGGGGGGGGDLDRPWTGSNINTTPAETELFRNGTSVSVGDGLRANFWHWKCTKANCTSIYVPNWLGGKI